MTEREMSVRKAAADAAAYLREHGWQPAQRDLAANSGPCCVLDAIDAVAPSPEGSWSPIFRETRDRFRNLISGGQGYVLIHTWNDTKAKPGEAIALLERVAAGEGREE